ncbi:MAG TPA: NAD(+)/NADH kinase [Ignavibacteriaceae bacterium]|nr:NAD(+)/NADH kinase [Ignavibacteriaceae bacterium]
MTIGIIANINKPKVVEVVSNFIRKLKANGMDFLISETLLSKKNLFTEKTNKSSYVNNDKLCKNSDIIISIGGDGTMLASAHKAQFHNTPVLGVNLGKLGFLAEANISEMDIFIDEIKNGNYEIEERMVIESQCCGHKLEKLYAINDFVIDKAGWPKMIDINIAVDSEYLTTFAADGLIISTPTGSTGYSLSVGGPIVSPKTDVIILSPISPHSLTVRPIVFPGNQEITIKANSLYKEIQVNCDGQRVFSFAPPLELNIKKSSRPLKLVHTSFSSYFETLRTKLLWGIDLRNNNLHK